MVSPNAFMTNDARIVESSSRTWQRFPLTAKTPRGRKLRVMDTIAARLGGSDGAL